MPSGRIQDDVVRIALDKVEGFPFERFANAFYSSLVGASVVPLGGQKDGRADARDGTIFEDGTRAETYYQASVDADADEIERSEGNESLVNSVTDALALWALEGTDLDVGILRTTAEVLDRIVDELPSVRNLVAPRLRRRLMAMGKKEYPGGRAVRWHRAEDAFCLPTRSVSAFEEENTADRPGWRTG